jgi:indolepyruvate ferredoxin oxidoreductase alpha subunit
VLCPSFYRTEIISNPSLWDKTKQVLRNAVIGTLQRGIDRRLSGIHASV